MSFRVWVGKEDFTFRYKESYGKPLKALLENFFSEYIVKPTTRDVITFAIDNGYISPLDMKAPFGLHKPWGTTPSKGHGIAYQDIKKVCPEVEELKSLQEVYQGWNILQGEYK